MQKMFSIENDIRLIHDFNSKWVESCAGKLKLKLIYKNSRPNSYSFELVFKKI